MRDRVQYVNEVRYNLGLALLVLSVYLCLAGSVFLTWEDMHSSPAVVAVAVVQQAQ